ncbi:hypothetical protein X745_30890 [Mesorhizobium sp. LNJC374B00]|nr:hypothetical protein X745_30890 [Mesorhizobium sp. LNJC374B00]
MVTGIGPVALDVESTEEGEADLAVWRASDGASSARKTRRNRVRGGSSRKESRLQRFGRTEAVQTVHPVQALHEFLRRLEDGGSQSHKFDEAYALNSQLQAPAIVLDKGVLMPIPRDEQRRACCLCLRIGQPFEWPAGATQDPLYAQICYGNDAADRVTNQTRPSRSS